MKLTGIKFTASTGGLTAHATNYASLIVSKRDGAGGAAAPITTFASDTVTTDDCTQWVPKELFTSPYTTFTACLIPAGSVLTFQITKAASGVVVPGGVLNITLEEQ
jgi:hypothetical protein